MIFGFDISKDEPGHSTAGVALLMPVGSITVPVITATVLLNMLSRWTNMTTLYCVVLHPFEALHIYVCMVNFLHHSPHFQYVPDVLIFTRVRSPSPRQPPRNELSLPCRPNVTTCIDLSPLQRDNQRTTSRTCHRFAAIYYILRLNNLSMTSNRFRRPPQPRQRDRSQPRMTVSLLLQRLRHCYLPHYTLARHPHLRQAMSSTASKSARESLELMMRMRKLHGRSW